MRAIIAVLVVSVTMAIGCKAVPDGDDLDRLMEQVAGIPTEIRSVMAKWAANRTAYGYLLHYQSSTQLGTSGCEDDSGKPVFVKPVQMSKMYACLNTMQTTTYLECLALILTDIADETPDLFCEWNTHQSGLAPDEIPVEFKADRITDQNIADALLGPPPPLEIQLMLMGLPGMVGPGGALCPQGVDWACVDNPLDDAPPSTAAASGGGDR